MAPRVVAHENASGLTRPGWCRRQGSSSGNRNRSPGARSRERTNPMCLRVASVRRTQAIDSISYRLGWFRWRYFVHSVTWKRMRPWPSGSCEHSTISSRRLRPLITVAYRQVAHGAARRARRCLLEPSCACVVSFSGGAYQSTPPFDPPARDGLTPGPPHSPTRGARPAPRPGAGPSWRAGTSRVSLPPECAHRRAPASRERPTGTPRPMRASPSPLVARRPARTSLRPRPRPRPLQPHPPNPLHATVAEPDRVLDGAFAFRNVVVHDPDRALDRPLDILDRLPPLACRQGVPDQPAVSRDRVAAASPTAEVARLELAPLVGRVGQWVVAHDPVPPGHRAPPRRVRSSSSRMTRRSVSSSVLSFCSTCRPSASFINV